MIDEITIAMAQAQICDAMKRAKVRPSELARRLRVSPPYVSRLLHQGENMTIAQLARVFFALGYEIRFKLVKARYRR